MTKLIGTPIKDTAVASSLRSLYRYGWSSDFRNSVYSSIFAKENFHQYNDELIRRKIPTITFEDYKSSIDYHINHYFPTETIINRLVDLSDPVADAPGNFVIDDHVVDSRDGISLEILERAYRFQYELTGDLKEMNFNTKDILTIENAKTFVHDCINSNPLVPVTIKDSNKKLEIYFNESDDKGYFPKINGDEIARSIRENYPDVDENEINNLISDFEESLNEVNDVFNACQDVYLNWSKHQDVAKKLQSRDQSIELSM